MIRRVRRGDEVVIPGFGLMDGDFHQYVDRVCGWRRFHVSMGLLTHWNTTKDFRWDGQRWVHKKIRDA